MPTETLPPTPPTFSVPFKLQASETVPGTALILDATGRPLANCALAQPWEECGPALAGILDLAHEGLLARAKMPGYAAFALAYALQGLFAQTRMAPRMGCPALLAWVNGGIEAWKLHYGDVKPPPEDVRVQLETMRDDAQGWWFVDKEGNFDFRADAQPEAPPATPAPAPAPAKSRILTH